MELRIALVERFANFVALDSEYGPFIVNVHCQYHAEALRTTGKPHIQNELNAILALVSTLPEDAVFVDAGANAGFITIPAAHALRERNGVVYAFEPQRMLFYALCGSVALNGLENVIVRNAGLGSRAENITVRSLDYGAPQDHGLYSLVDNARPEFTAQPGQMAIGDVLLPDLVFRAGGTRCVHDVDIVPIDQLGLPRLDFLKLDVEGMELEILQGAQAAITEYRPWCWVEHWKFTIDDVKRPFTGLEYRFFEINSMLMLCAPQQRISESGFSTNAREI